MVGEGVIKEKEGEEKGEGGRTYGGGRKRRRGDEREKVEVEEGAKKR